ncbi:hypothetical protein INH39_21710 [Massilia violaceinigra]|uniref:Novel toxin 15 domain-containing protein n=1 Tax=Massilia violaceinigra TaxID=2045208 RepID=A0ABY4A608_9BURK|nr:polymorphic toxin type 15 domain-containing protein [Massilia violaceinigra]UOD28073.1 hypothetical protein INH39_21710 [Massilia violaceinigra]
MGNDIDDMWRVWSMLQHKEDALKWGGRQGNAGPQYDSIGRLLSSSDHGHMGWSYERMGRVGRVRKALHDSGPLAFQMIAQRLTGIDLSAIWPILVSACQDIALYYGGTVVAGGLIGGVGGALLGGVGALPGAAAGAAAGSYAGGWVLAMLGLKSLVEGLAQAVPEALRYYESGFLEAWGPLRQDRQHGFVSRATGDPAFAALDFANGHVIMVLAILTALLAYFTRGKGGKAALLSDIRRSPRLGPRVAKWIEENERRLAQHPALQSRGRGGAAGGSAPAPAPKRRPDRKDEPTVPKGMPKKEVPCFNSNDLPQSKFPEFDRQLAGQEKGINEMTVDEYLKGRKAFDAKESVRDPNVARRARANYQEEMKEKLFNQFRESGMSVAQARVAAAEGAKSRMKTLAALHNPDMVAAGKDKISTFGDRNVNSRIGAQWKKGQRLVQLDEAAKEIAESMRGRTLMNVTLERCK